MNLKILSCSIFVAASLPTLALAQSPSAWMDRDVKGAWQSGFQGQGSRVIVFDFFDEVRNRSAIIGSRRENYNHGEAMADIVRTLAPRASVFEVEASRNWLMIQPRSGSLNIINWSGAYEAHHRHMHIPPEHLPNNVRSIIDAGVSGTALVVKAAGNENKAINTPDSNGYLDYGAGNLKRAKSAIFVGALRKNGQDTWFGTLRQSYSNYPGEDKRYQSRFLFVGVEERDFDYRINNKSASAGTSAATAIVSGYAAILSSKFPKENAEDIAERLLSTARRDTLLNGNNPAAYGRGEASLSRALAARTVR